MFPVTIHANQRWACKSPTGFSHRKYYQHQKTHHPPEFVYVGLPHVLSYHGSHPPALYRVRAPSIICLTPPLSSCLLLGSLRRLYLVSHYRNPAQCSSGMPLFLSASSEGCTCAYCILPCPIQSCLLCHSLLSVSPKELVHGLALFCHWPFTQPRPSTVLT